MAPCRLWCVGQVRAQTEGRKSSGTCRGEQLGRAQMKAWPWLIALWKRSGLALLSIQRGRVGAGGFAEPTTALGLVARLQMNEAVEGGWPLGDCQELGKGRALRTMRWLEGLVGLALGFQLCREAGAASQLFLTPFPSYPPRHSHLAPLFDNPKLDKELRAMLREKFPEFCSSPSPPIEGRERAGGRGRLQQGFPQRSHSESCLQEVRAGPQGDDESSGCLRLWVAVSSPHPSPVAW